jgi:predicted AAA+ superfamily ATPase
MGSLTPEGKVKRKVSELLKRYNVWYFYPANNGFGKGGIPDVIACVDGRLVGIEVKADKKSKPSELQKICGKEIQEAGGIWLVVCDDETLAELETTIRKLDVSS